MAKQLVIPDKTMGAKEFYHEFTLHTVGLDEFLTEDDIATMMEQYAALKEEKAFNAGRERSGATKQEPYPELIYEDFKHYKES